MNYALLIAALIQIESAGNDQAIGDGGRSVGCLQISMAVIQDVNRVYGRHFLPIDQFNRRKSMEICKLYLMHWGANYERRTGLAPTLQVLGRIWNGGPTGDMKHSTERYSVKVREMMEVPK